MASISEITTFLPKMLKKISKIVKSDQNVFKNDPFTAYISFWPTSYHTWRYEPWRFTQNAPFSIKPVQNDAKTHLKWSETSLKLLKFCPKWQKLLQNNLKMSNII